MIFQVEKTWEVNSPLMGAFPENGTATFSIVELSFNQYFFILKVAIHVGDEAGEDGDIIWRTYLIDSLECVMNTLENNNIADHKLSIYLPDRISDDNEASVQRIAEISIGKDEEDLVTCHYKCANGKIFYDLMREGELYLTEERCIYRFDNYNTRSKNKPVVVKDE